MTELYQEHGQSIIGVEAIAREHSSSYGVVAGDAYAKSLLKLNRIVEKPKPEEAPSNLGVVGRYILSPSIFNHLRMIKPGAGGEWQLTDAIASLLRHDTVLAYEFDGIRYDCGSKIGYLKATVQFALKHSEVKDSFKEFLDALSTDSPGSTFSAPSDIASSLAGLSLPKRNDRSVLHTNAA